MAFELSTTMGFPSIPCKIVAVLGLKLAGVENRKLPPLV